MRRLSARHLLVMLLLSVIVGWGEAHAAPYYEGKTITLIVATNPGGGYDRTGRLVAKYLPKYIPGEPTIIVENMPGAGHIVAANYIYNKAKPDGLTIATMNRGLVFAQLAKAPAIRFDIRKFAWIGSVAVEPEVLFIRNDLPYKTVEDLRRAKGPIPIASEGPGTTSYQFAMLLNAFAGFNFKTITYPSGSASRLSLERKETDARVGSYSSDKKLVARGVLRPILRGSVSIPELESLPVNEDFAKDSMGKTLLAMLNSVDRIGRPFMAPPGTPPNVMGILRDAFAKVTKDPGLLADAKKLRIEIDFAPEDQCMKVLNYELDQPKNVLREFAKYVKF